MSSKVMSYAMRNIGGNIENVEENPADFISKKKTSPTRGDKNRREGGQKNASLGSVEGDAKLNGRVSLSISGRGGNVNRKNDVLNDD
jgi:hypothetical protein